MTDRPIPPMYFSLRTTQPFADMSLRDVDGEEGVRLTIADGVVVGLFLPDVRICSASRRSARRPASTPTSAGAACAGTWTSASRSARG